MLKAVSSISNAIGALNYKGTWDASANTPALASGVGTKGDYYVVSVAGSTNLDGITTWYVGDWAAFNGTVWQRLEGGVDDPAPSLKSNSTTGLMQITGPATGQTRVVTIPDANATMARTDAGQTFTGDQRINGLLSLNTGASGLQTTRSMSFLTTGGCTGYMSHSTSDGNGDSYYEFGYNGTKIGSITQSGTTGVNFNNTSDYRLKNNAAPLTGSGAFIDALQPKTWTWKLDGTKGSGFIAHEYQLVSPSSVSGEKDATEIVEIKDDEGNVTATEIRPVYQGLNYASPETMANIIAELQDLRRRVAALESK